MEHSSRTIPRMNLASGFCRLLLLLTVSICVPGALGSSHSRLRNRRFLPGAFSVPDNPVSPLPLPPSSYPPPSPPFPPPSPPFPPPSPPFPPPSPPPPSSPASISLESPAPSPSTPPETAPVHPPLPSSLSPSYSPLPPQPAPSRSTWNQPEKAGVAIAAIAALLQVAVVAFLLIKRHQMMAAVEYEDYDDDYDHSDPDYRHSEHSA